MLPRVVTMAADGSGEARGDHAEDTRARPPHDPLADLVDLAGRRVSARAFSDPAVYARERTEIFGRSWLYVAHTSQLPKPGDYVASWMGDDRVLVWRGPDGRLRVFLDACPHRGARVCPADKGQAAELTCPFHGRRFDSAGQALGAHAGEPGLYEVPRVDEYRGLVFACFDADACTLAEHLGDLRWHLEVILAHAGPSSRVLEGVHRWTFAGNWKFPAEQSTGDPTHQLGVHGSMTHLGFDMTFGRGALDFVGHFPQGHGILNITPRERVLTTKFQDSVFERARERLSPEQAQFLRCLTVTAVFPNLEIVSYPGFIALRVWQPRGVDQTEIWSWGLVPADSPELYVTSSRRLLGRYFSPTGVLEQDDLEVWESCQRGVDGRQRAQGWFRYALTGEPVAHLAGIPGELRGAPSEHANFGFFAAWQRQLAGALR